MAENVKSSLTGFVQKRGRINLRNNWKKFVGGYDIKISGGV